MVMFSLHFSQLSAKLLTKPLLCTGVTHCRLPRHPPLLPSSSGTALLPAASTQAAMASSPAHTLL